MKQSNKNATSNKDSSVFYRQTHSINSLIETYSDRLSDKFTQIMKEEQEDEGERKIVKIAIIGAAIGGCSAAYFLEQLFRYDKSDSRRLEIDIYEEESQVGGKQAVAIEYNGNKYEPRPIYVNLFKHYVKNFAYQAGCKIRNEIQEGWVNLLIDSNGVLFRRDNKKFASLFKVIARLFSGLLLKLRLFKFVELLRLFTGYVLYREKFLELQNDSYSFENVEKMLRKIDPSLFTLTQQPTIKKFWNELLPANWWSLAKFKYLGHNGSTALLGFNSLINLFDGGYLEYGGNERICNYLLDECETVRLLTDTHVKSVGFDDKASDTMNKLVYVRKGNEKEVAKSYDYVILTFPLVKDMEKQRDFSLEILYRDFIDYELNYIYSYIVDGRLALSCLSEHDKLVSIHTGDSSLKYQSIRTILSAKNTLLYKVDSGEKELPETVYEELFDQGYKLVAKKKTFLSPVFKPKVKYSPHSFPQIILDGRRRARVLNLTSMEWLESSAEMAIVSARNIALLITKKELGQKQASESNLAYQASNRHITENFFIMFMRQLKIIAYFSTFGSLLFSLNRIKNIVC